MRTTFCEMRCGRKTTRPTALGLFARPCRARPCQLGGARATCDQLASQSPGAGSRCR
jgi:hypothetical protein